MRPRRSARSACRVRFPKRVEEFARGRVSASLGEMRSRVTEASGQGESPEEKGGRITRVPVHKGIGDHSAPTAILPVEPLSA